MLREQARSLQMGTPTPATYVPLPGDARKVAAAVHVLNRIGFGPKPGDVAHIVESQGGAAGYIEEQLADKGDEDPALEWRVNGLDVQQTEKDSPDVLSSMPDDQLLTETEQAALLRAVYSRHQLREMLADFWTNHFNIYAIKKDGRILIPTDTEHVLRPNLLGSFREMLIASAHSAAMLAYLDNQENRRGVANENYARELLELHTLGVNSGYTQKDIQEVARCFTGWTVQTGRAPFDIHRSDFQLHGDEAKMASSLRDRLALRKSDGKKPEPELYRPGFAYDAQLHDDGAKYIPFLNLRIAPKGGPHDAEVVLEQLAAHPATARFIARKLCRRFLGHAPDAMVAKAANAYLKNKSDIRATLRPILLDGLLIPSENRPILKRPLEFVMSSLRALASDTDGGANVQKHLADMGQPLYQWPMPDGFPEKAAAWTGSLLPRWNFALALTSNTIGGTTTDLNAPLVAAKARTDDAILNTLVETVLSRPHDAPEARSIREQIGRHIAKARQSSVPDATVLAEATGLLLASPAFQWR